VSARILIPTFTFVAFVSAVFGALTATPARAVVNYGLYVNPGGSSNALTCGWHSTCVWPYSWGNALDWGNDPDTYKFVYWRSWGTSDSGSGTMAYAYPYNASSDICHGAGANVYDLGWTWRGSVVWLHTSLSGSAPTVYINGSWSGAFTSSGPMGTTVPTEKDVSCPWDGPHLHQYSTASGWYANTGVYPSAPTTGSGYSLADFGNWQNRTSWSN
jgi:hypothetical protein